MFLFWLLLIWRMWDWPGMRHYEAGAGPPGLPLANTKAATAPRDAGSRMDRASFR